MNIINLRQKWGPYNQGNRITWGCISEGLLYHDSYVCHVDIFLYRLLGPRNTNRFYQHAHSTSDFHQSSQQPERNIMSALGDITNQLCHVQDCITTLSNKVDALSEKTDHLSNRVTSMEEQQSGPLKKRKVLNSSRIICKCKQHPFM